MRQAKIWIAVQNMETALRQYILFNMNPRPFSSGPRSALVTFRKSGWARGPLPNNSRQERIDLRFALSRQK